MPPQAIDEKIKSFSEVIKLAEKIAIPLRDPLKPSIPENIKNMISHKNQIRRWYQKEREPEAKIVLKILQREEEKRIKFALNAWKADIFKRQLKGYKVYDTRLHLVTKKFLREKPDFPPLITENKCLITSSEKAESLSSEFERVHTQNTYLNDPVHDEEVEKTVNTFFEDDEKFSTPVDPASLEEVKEIIKSLENQKAPGEDGIKSILLKNLPVIGLLFLLSIINTILDTTAWPSAWKNGVVTPILKAGKDSRFLSSYRPITLLSILSKVTEKVLNKKLLVTG